MASYAYHVEITEHRGFHFRIEHHYDEHSSEPPWERSCGHGPVSEQHTYDRWAGGRSKRPGQVPMTTASSYTRMYDWQEATKIAKRDGWGLSDDRLARLRTALGREPTRKQIVREAVALDYEFLRGWCSDEWHYMGVIVMFDREHYDSVVVPEGKFADALDDQASESLWGIESNAGDYLDEVVIECANALLAQLPDDVVMRAQMERPTMLVAA